MEDLKKIKFNSYKEYGNWIRENYDRTYSANRLIENAGLLIDKLKENANSPCLTGVTVRFLSEEEFKNSKFFKT